MSNDLLEQYIDLFNEMPPMIMAMSYGHPVYQNLMKVSIDTKTPITLGQVEKEMKKQNIKYDLGE